MISGNELSQSVGVLVCRCISSHKLRRSLRPWEFHWDRNLQEKAGSEGTYRREATCCKKGIWPARQVPET